MEKKRKVIQDYNSFAEFYDRRYRDIQNYKFQLIFKKISLIKGIYLDAGSGTNLFFEFLKSQGNYEGIRIICVDMSREMLKIGKDKHLIDYLILGDIENLPFRTNIFNGVISITSLQNIPTIEKGVEEIQRVLKKKGLVAISILKKNLVLSKLHELLNKYIKNLNIIQEDECEDWIFFRKLKEDKNSF